MSWFPKGTNLVSVFLPGDTAVELPVGESVAFRIEAPFNCYVLLGSSGVVADADSMRVVANTAERILVGTEEALSIYSRAGVAGYVSVLWEA